ncbi:MAG: ribosomal RNA small subunit methyltransferase A [Candidatus Doudnabacteria bacterium RIFCSPHIGHO2_02_FULL_48_21]|uniref:Ribosomal RNA small subunit methyltransferase A n=1 Tax=Candidatus Doudnabacteria bacterium RIFCSPLOWO2_02_FULL_48_13 TaxID=1817845 RepID=A0A1F5QDD8_9BACT|nr:MAG: ribosomal RNA small subunit methyltransferase A [Candidatus Doudnabacteria bacterium RIFCSPHIGHO2_01_48_18]OGE90955.1 MAG: ribosomal RNA small subunit methyltransferase A [Candidatus Doudnabacteria bacterium RIFCSPHIGHO2_12_FULL_47_25]OGE92818.1 MAG: ribosomal RNA small subunit methyltransferase A [Candidatus Doudnabacteria bacterium RIFCSPHIGHO2_02_FULL_48_21]OGE98135.1 MAG: ribosomal RNA small subunit methyltransferase A [Candidatus Doudnabacteria bacterium RIFCSPLOWO2_01_FULL_48_57]O
MDIDQLKSELSRFGIKPKKTLGQNFLVSEEILSEIVAAAELTPDDTVLEIGPGLGVLTSALGERAGLVLAVEKDKKIYSVLRKLFKNKKNVKIINEDALFMDFSVILNSIQDPDWIPDQVRNDKHLDYKVVANIPYYITGKLLQNFLTSDHKPSLMVLLLQKEVAERIVAKPGNMSILSISAQLYCDPDVVTIVGKENFYPPPQVDSAVVRLRILDKPRLAVEEKKFFQLVKIGFAGKRKQLQNNLSNGYQKGRDYKTMLEELGINPLARAQDLSLEDWARLYKALIDNQKPADI